MDSWVYDVEVGDWTACPIYYIVSSGWVIQQILFILHEKKSVISVDTMDATRLKVILTIIILLVGVMIPFMLTSSDDVEADIATGMAIDFDDMDVSWVDMNLEQFDSGWMALEYACQLKSYSLTMDSNGDVLEIKGVYSNSDKSWSYWGIKSGSTTWKLIDSSSNPKDYTVTSWAYRSEGEVPTVAVDVLGNCIYGFPKANSIVSLSASTTEILGSLNAASAVVGVDMYSDYPDSIMDGRNNGSISIVGDYVGPSFELIMECEADLIIGDDSNSSQAGVCERLLANGRSAILLYDGENLNTVLKNIYIVGVVSGRQAAASTVLSDISGVIDTVLGSIDADPGVSDKKTLVTLSPDKSPYVSGLGTYISDTLADVHGLNVITDAEGWMKINAEAIADSNPAKIIIIVSAYDGVVYDYNEMMASLSPEWKSTDAYKSGEIYLIQDEAANLLQRCSPRIAQLVELLGVIIQPDTFGGSISKTIGDDYEDYLVYSKDMGYNL